MLIFRAWATCAGTEFEEVIYHVSQCFDGINEISEGHEKGPLYKEN